MQKRSNDCKSLFTMTGRSRIKTRKPS